MKNLLLGLCGAALLCGCASEQKYNRELDGFVNQPVNKVEEKFGQPSAAKIIDNNSMIITYTRADSAYVPSEYYLYDNVVVPGEEIVYSPFTGDYDFSPLAESFGYTVEYVCQTSFLVEDGIVRAWRWKGNDCVAY